ncbi:MAG: carboxypeptidase-like regulatory domain-containing protein, partial [Candidatus Thorarchaeota archaeon]
FGSGAGIMSCVWMDGNYDWSDPAFRLSAGVSLNLAVNVVADVLHSIAVVGIGEEVDPPVVTGGVSGRVLGEDGSPLEGAWVRLKDDSSGSIVDSDFTGQDGAFGFTDVDLGEYALQVTSEGYVGFETTSFTLSEVSPEADVGSIDLERAPEEDIAGSSDLGWIWWAVFAGLICVLGVLTILLRRRGKEDY